MKFAVVFTLVALATAAPEGSSICDVSGASDKIASSEMGPNKQDLFDAYKFTPDTTELTPGKVIEIAVTGKAFDGFLIYATGTDPNARIGKFSLLAGTGPCTACSAQKLDAPESVLTHTVGSKFNNPTFQYTIPAAGFDGSISLNAIVLQKHSSGGYAWGVFPNAVTIGTKGATVPPGAAAPGAQDANAASLPTQGYVPPPPEIDVVDNSEEKCPPAQTVTQTVTVTAAPIIKIRKCKPKTAVVPKNESKAPEPTPEPTPEYTPVGESSTSPCPQETNPAVQY